MDWDRPFTAFGLMFIFVGVVLVLIPVIVKLIPEVQVEKIPWFLLYVYRRDGFFFATSPLLIILALVSLLRAFLER